MDTILATLQQYKEHAETRGLTVFAIALKGSQNYNLSDSESDIDANLVFIPTLAQLRTGDKFKFTFPTGEVTCHNIYQFAEIVSKGNPQWIEVCHTPYIIGDLSMFKHYQLNPSALKGMVMEKVAAFSRLYPSRAKYIEQFGYDPKQLHHIIRLYDSLLHNDPIHKYYNYDQAYMMGIKRGTLPGSLSQASALRDLYIEKIAEIYEDRKLSYQPQPVDYDMIDTIVMNTYESLWSQSCTTQLVLH